MNKYPKVNYIGNKEKITDWIIDNLPMKNGRVLDLFCGGCSVSYALKAKGYDVISNDALYSSFVLAKAIIENTSTTIDFSDFDIIVTENAVFEKFGEISFLIDNLYYEEEVLELARLIAISERLSGYKKYIFLALLRRAMIRKIPYSRMNIKWEEIKKLRNEEYSYKKYGRYRHYHNISFTEHILANLNQYNSAIFDNGQECLALNLDAIECLESLNTPVDVVYMDPPYPSTMNKYEEFYGSFGKIFERGQEVITDLTERSEFLHNFEKIIKACMGKTSYIAISLNNKSYPSSNLLINQILPYIESFNEYTTKHTYKVTGKENKKKNFEILLVCKLKEN